MTEEEKNELAALIDAAFARHPPVCPNGIDVETAATLKSFAEAVRSGRKTAYKALVSLAIGAICAAVLAGIRELFNK